MVDEVLPALTLRDSQRCELRAVLLRRNLVMSKVRPRHRVQALTSFMSFDIANRGIFKQVRWVRLVRSLLDAANVSEKLCLLAHMRQLEFVFGW